MIENIFLNPKNILNGSTNFIDIREYVVVTPLNDGMCYAHIGNEFMYTEKRFIFKSRIISRGLSTNFDFHIIKKIICLDFVFWSRHLSPLYYLYMCLFKECCHSLCFPFLFFPPTKGWVMSNVTKVRPTFFVPSQS